MWFQLLGPLLLRIEAVIVYLLGWGLLADRYGLPIRDYWQTVWSANKRLLADHSQNM